MNLRRGMRQEPPRRIDATADAVAAEVRSTSFGFLSRPEGAQRGLLSPRRGGRSAWVGTGRAPV